MSEKATAADVEAARRERDEMRERAEHAEEQLSLLGNEMIYEGNSVSYIYSKMKAYRSSLTDAAKDYDELASIAGEMAGAIEEYDAALDAYHRYLATPEVVDRRDAALDGLSEALSRYTAFMEGKG